MDKSSSINYFCLCLGLIYFKEKQKAMKIKLRIWQKMIIFIIGTAVIVFSSIFVFISLSSRSIIYNNSVEYTNAIAKQNAITIENWLNSDMAIARTLSNAFLEYKALPQEKWLDLFRNMENRVYDANPQIDAIRDSWELNNLDPNWNKDFGRHFYLVYHENGVLKTQRDIRSLTGDPDTYGIMKKAGCETISEPYVSVLQKGILKTTLAAPMYEKGQYIGLVGVDIVLSNFQKLVNNIRPFSNSYAFLLSNKGIFTAHPDTSFFEKNINEKQPDLVKQFNIIGRVQRGEEFNFSYTSKTGKDFYYALMPIQVGKTKTPWSLGIVVPKNEIMAKANNNYNINFIAGIVGLMILVFILILFTKSITQPINKITSYLLQVSKGKIDKSMNLNINTGDEIEVMANALSASITGINNKTDFARLIGSGNLEANLELLSEDDVLGKSLLDMRDNLIKAKEAENKRKLEEEKIKWTNEGLALFGDILRQNNNNQSLLGDEIIKNLVWYLNATQGGLFVINDKSEREELELISAFAYDRKKFLEKSFAKGEGLVGTCAAERDVIHLVEIPQDYIEITSGLGGANPNALLLVPLTIEEEVLGVIELTSFNKFQVHEIDLVKKLAQSIASTLQSVRINSRTSELLEKSQEQAEMMAAQEEEMRQNMEEMQTTQEEMRRKEDVMKHILSDMENQENDLKKNITKLKDEQ